MAGQQDNDRSRAARHLAEGLRPVAPGSQQSEMTISRIRAPGLDLRGLGQALMRWYQTQDLESNVDDGEGAVVVRCRAHTARKLIGTGLELTVILRQEGPDLAVEMGGVKWTDKGAVAAVGILTLPAGGVGLVPLGTAAWGAWRQSRLPGQTMEFLKAAAPAFMAAAGSFTPGDPERTPPTPPATPIDVNSATPEHLSRIPGINIDLARRIVIDRESRHGFHTWDEVLQLLAPHVQAHQLAEIQRLLVIATPTPPPRRRDRPKPKPQGRKIDLDP